MEDITAVHFLPDPRQPGAGQLADVPPLSLDSDRTKDEHVESWVTHLRAFWGSSAHFAVLTTFIDEKEATSQAAIPCMDLLQFAGILQRLNPGSWLIAAPPVRWGRITYCLERGEWTIKVRV